MYAYREQVCLIQISASPTKITLSIHWVLTICTGLGEIIQDPAVRKVFSTLQNMIMILLKRQFDWQLHNLFDTMWAARILGYQRYGLASMIETVYNIKLDKRYQKSNWCKRPLSPEQLTYAQLDTHYLLNLT